MDTAERVARFGSARLQEIYAGMDRETFEQEYECRFVEEADGFITYAEIMPGVKDDLVLETDFARLSRSPLDSPRSPLYAGFDVGRSVHPSELVVIEREPGGPGTVRLLLTLRKTEFTEQAATLHALLSGGNVKRLCLDATGMGAPLGEELARRYPLRVEPVTFTAALKERLAVGVKVALQRREIALPPDRELIAQLRGIRRSFGESGRLRFDSPGAGESDAGPNTHSDRFWALALAWHASESGQRTTVGVRRVR